MKNSKAQSVKANKKAAPKKGVLKRLIKLMFAFYPVMLPLAVVCIIVNAVISSIPTIFMRNIIDLLDASYQAGDWSAISNQVLNYVLILGMLYIVSLIASVLYAQLLAIITQGTLKKLRQKMFDNMESLPVKYFDTNSHGDIMSYYTNDIDALRQMISQSIPQLMSSGIIVLTVFFIMLYYSLWLALIVVGGTVVMYFVTRSISGNSSKYFVRQQIAIAKEEGYIEEIMNGQKVVKVFCREPQCLSDFDRINDKLYNESRLANKYGNMLAPILNNIGNILYVIVAVAGGAMLLMGAPNVAIGGMALTIGVAVPFLNMTKQFSGNINQVSMQITSVVMGLAGTRRVMELLDVQPESDDGYVTLVNAKQLDNGELTECEERTGMWAWKHPHGDGTITYTQVKGEVALSEVDFEYDPGKPVLHDVSVYAKPGQKVAFVGSTGAGKTTITNLLNRFYDIADGKIRYDGINVNKIKKSDLRRALGIVLQDTNLFTGTVMDNIRYGKLNATDEDCIAAAKLAGADDFITRLPQGYDTAVLSNGANLSQGQRQLLSIARAAVADPPVMILDEATSSIDTRTEAIISRGMDALMQGRTVFVIAHRLSTVKNADVIIVLEHGRIIERGNHEQLIEERGQYYKLYTGAFEME